MWTNGIVLTRLAGLDSRRIALSTAGVLTAAFGVCGAARRHLDDPGPARRPPGLALDHPGARAVAARRRRRADRARLEPARRSAPGRATCAAARRARRSCSAITALATVLATCVAVAHGDSERDQRHERQLAIAENDLLPRDGRAGRPADRRRLDRAGPAVGAALAVRRARGAAAGPEGADLGRARAQRRPRRPGALRRRRRQHGHPLRFKIVYSSSRGKGDPTRERRPAVRRPHRAAGRDPLAARRAPPASCPPSTARRASIAVAVPVRAAGSGASGAFLATFSVAGVRAAVGAHLPHGTRIALVAGRRGQRAARTRARSTCGSATASGPSPSGSPTARQGLALATLLVGGLLTILIGVVGSQSRRRERDALGVIAMRRAERDRAELARLEAEARSRVLAETSTDLICVLEPDGSVRYASPACRDLLGLEPEALLGRRVHRPRARGRRRGRGGGARRRRGGPGLDHPPDAPADGHGVGRDAAARRPRPRDPRARRDPR